MKCTITTWNNIGARKGEVPNREKKISTSKAKKKKKKTEMAR
jgi:hypothetical protein